MSNNKNIEPAVTIQKPSMREFIRSFLFWFLLIYAAFGIFKYFSGDTESSNTEPVSVEDAVEISVAGKSKVVMGSMPEWNIVNKGTETVTFKDPCTEGGVFGLERLVNGNVVNLWDNAYCGLQPMEGFSLEGGQKVTLAFPMVNQKVFSESGEYRLTMGFNDQSYSSEVLKVREPGFIRRVFRTFVTRPIFNALAALVHSLPNHSLGLAIIIITVIIRAILFIPNQRAIKSQEAMKVIQPKIKALQEQYKDNQQMLAMKTMELYRKHQVSPLSSCLPILLQMPILFGLYYTVMDGLSPHLEHLLYSFQSHIDLSILEPIFLTLDLTKMNILQWKYALLVVLVAFAQWVTLRISLGRNKKKKDTKSKKPGLVNNKKDAPDMAAQMQDMMGMMQWIFPVMIAFFTASLPAVVGLYWLTSTVLGGLQQWYVYKKVRTPETTRKV